MIRIYREFFEEYLEIFEGFYNFAMQTEVTFRGELHHRYVAAAQ